MKNNSYHISIEVEKSPELVFNAIREIPKWWTKDFEGSTANLGDEFVIHHPNAHYSKQKLVELVPGKKIVWLVTESYLYWLEKDKHEWTDTRMIFEIGANDDKTLLHFTHEGLVPEKECFSRVTAGWDLVIKDHLAGFITNGQTIKGGHA